MEFEDLLLPTSKGRGGALGLATSRTVIPAARSTTTTINSSMMAMHNSAVTDPVMGLNSLLFAKSTRSEYTNLTKMKGTETATASKRRVSPGSVLEVWPMVKMTSTRMQRASQARRMSRTATLVLMSTIGTPDPEGMEVELVPPMMPRIRARIVKRWMKRKILDGRGFLVESFLFLSLVSGLHAFDFLLGRGVGEIIHSGKQTNAGQDQRREANGAADYRGSFDAGGMVRDGRELAAGAHDADGGEGDEEVPAQVSAEAMAEGDQEGEEETGKVDDEFEDGDAVAIVDCHGPRSG